MLPYLVYWMKIFIRGIRNFVRKYRKPPDYVVFTLEGDYPELPTPTNYPIIQFFRPPKLNLFLLREQIQIVGNDSRIKGVIFLLRPLDMPLAKVDVIRELIFSLKSKGKRVVAWSYEYDTPRYYLASAADDILLLPGGSISPLGLYQHHTYLGDALKKLGLAADFIQISPYKSAADMFSRNEMSTEVREMGNWLADAAFDEILTAVADSRKIDKEAAKAIIDQTPCTDLKAVEIGAVDKLLGEEDLPAHLGSEEKPVVLNSFNNAIKKLFLSPLKKPGKYIALMQINGMIIDGRSSQPPVQPPIPVPIIMDARAGDMSVIGTIRQIIADKQAAGVVLYVNSRGGSATASESMRIALEKLASQKPLIVVMGPVAASGGYWVSTPGRFILSQPNTITGSIGVVSGKIADMGLMEKLLINQEVISRGKNIGIYQTDTPFSDIEREIVWKYIERIYDMFLDRVSESRDLSKDAVDEIGRGRVWTGRQALENGLIDEFGGINHAIKKVCEITGLGDHAPIRFYFAGKQYLPPVSGPTLIINYGLEGINYVNGRVMCLTPWVYE